MPFAPDIVIFFGKVGIDLDDIVVGIGDIKVAKGGEDIVTYALGSCVGVCMYDETLGLGGMLHAMLPSVRGIVSEVKPDKYVDSGILHLYNELGHMGADTSHLKVKLVGGAKMYDYKTSLNEMDIGTANVIQARKSLRKLGVSIVREVTGGEVGRTVHFTPANGRVEIHSTDNRNEVI